MAIPGTDGVIHGAYKVSGQNRGDIVAVDVEGGQSIPSGYSALDWNKIGAVGPAGPPGPVLPGMFKAAHYLGGGVEAPQVLAPGVAEWPDGITVRAHVPAPTGEVVICGGASAIRTFDGAAVFGLLVANAAGSPNQWSFAYFIPHPAAGDSYVIDYTILCATLTE